MSINLRNRWYSHHRQEDFDLIENGKIAYISSMPKHYLKEIEATLIKTFIPRLNIKPTFSRLNRKNVILI
jgi:hypothetical protein